MIPVHLRAGRLLELSGIILNTWSSWPCLKHLSQARAKGSFERHHSSNGNLRSLVKVLPAGTVGTKFVPQDLLYF